MQEPYQCKTYCSLNDALLRASSLLMNSERMWSKVEFCILELQEMSSPCIQHTDLRCFEYTFLKNITPDCRFRTWKNIPMIAIIALRNEPLNLNYHRSTCVQQVDRKTKRYKVDVSNNGWIGLDWIGLDWIKAEYVRLE